MMGYYMCLCVCVSIYLQVNGIYCVSSYTFLVAIHYIYTAVNNQVPTYNTLYTAVTNQVPTYNALYTAVTNQVATYGTVILERGSGGHGHLFVQTSTLFTPVCDHTFGMREGDVACRQMGYTRAISVVKNS